MSGEDPRTALACGVALDTLIEQVADRLPPLDPWHQSSCPHCQAALAALREAWGEVQAFARAPVRIPAGLAARIIRRIRTLAERWAAPALLTGPRGSTEISERVIAQIGRLAALGVPGVALATVAAVLIDPAERNRARLRLRLAVAFGPAFDALAAAVRSEVSRRVAQQTGVQVSEVDVLIADVIGDG